MNPKGSCRLGDVNKSVKEAFAAVGSERAQPESVKEPRHDCCAVTTERHARAERAGILAVSASVPSAIVASACCWLALLLVAVGASAAGGSTSSSCRSASTGGRSA